ncbi:uncharacterized protein [Nicotiana tomentosiformis]|uniref:uncharacterized protein n=1 Tax=Nicotiana tomentosiformis TaxID=4098 RepID=UPI00051AD03A|nr:uncharacterized protein LOC104114053 [Nicotiana tomentosiformis]
MCIHPDVDMPIGYKPPKFDIFDGTGDPHAHLRTYRNKLVGVGRNEMLRIKLFIRILTGVSLTWYTCQNPQNWREWQDMVEDFINHFWFSKKITSDRLALVNLQKKSSKSFQEYARRWRSEAARAQPPLDDSELTKYFIRAQEGIYCEKMMGMMGQKFPELVKMGDFLEEGIKSGKVQSMATSQAASKAIQSGSIGSGKNKKEEVSAIITYYQSNPYHGNTSYTPNTHSSHLPTYAPVYNTQPYYNPQPQYNPPRAHTNPNPP